MPGISGKTITAIANDFPAKVLVYPNPASESFQLSWEGESAEVLSWQLINPQGKMIRSGEEARSLKGKRNISTSSLANGTYYLLLRLGENTRGETLIIRH